MGKGRSFWRLTLLALLVVTAAGVASCASEVEAGPRAWIDFPRDGASGPPGTPVPVVCHASAAKGVAEVLLSVNGAAYARGPLDEAGATFGKVTFEWLPDVPGVYTLMAQSYDSSGSASSPDMITVRIGEPVAVEPAAAASATPTEPTATPLPATPTPTTPPSVTPTATVMPSATATTVPSVTPTPFPPAQVKFVTDRSSVVPGECALLQWYVQHVTAVYLDGEGVVGEGTRSVCPDTTTTYTLHVEAPSGNVDEHITITVTAPPDTTPPPVPAPQVPADGLALGCRATQVLAWLPVTDPSGIAGYDVQLERQTTPGHWEQVQVWNLVADKQVSASVDCGLYYRWRVRARDGAGNYSAWSAWWQFAVALS